MGAEKAAPGGEEGTTLRAGVTFSRLWRKDLGQVPINWK